MRVSTLMPVIAALPSVFAAPQQPEFTNSTELPTHFAMLLLPHFQALDVFGPLDVLNTLSMLYGNRTAMTLTLLSRTMDPVGTTIKGMHGKGNFGEEILPTNTFAHVLGKKKNCPDKPGKGHDHMSTYSYGKGDDDGWGNGYARRHEGHAPSTPHGPALNHTMSMDKDIEVLLVPGGGGTRQNMTEEIAFVKEIYPKVPSPPSTLIPTNRSDTDYLQAKVHNLHLHWRHHPLPRRSARRQESNNQQARLALGHLHWSQCDLGAVSPVG